MKRAMQIFGWIFGCVFLLGGTPLAAAQEGVVDVTPAQVMYRDVDVVFLDVRTPKEYQQGHIVGAVNIDIRGADFAAQINRLDRNKMYIVHCAANVDDGRAERALRGMHAIGFTRLENLRGGYNAWVNAGGPVVEGP
ncbi:MAG: rhodanese-like domain-containing protein [Pseudomonadota bacterium]